MRTLARDMAAGEKGKDGDTIELAGWVHRIWIAEDVTFVMLRDWSAIVQLVFNGECSLPNNPPLTPESVISVRGIPVPNREAPGGVALDVRDITVISRAIKDLPYQVSGDASNSTLESILNNRILSLRSPKILSIFKIQATILEAFASYLNAQDFTQIKTSKIVLGATEEMSGLFELDYFERRVKLAQSSRFYRQVMASSGLERVFEISHVYRAEKHNTSRHLDEFVSLDVEIAFIESEKDLIALEKELLIYIFSEVEQKNKDDLEVWNARLPRPEAVSRAPVITYEEALRIVNQEAGKEKASGGRIFDITPEAEQLLCTWALKERGVDLVFVNEFPRRYRPFYTYPLSVGIGAVEGNTLTMSFDCLFRGMEITSGSRRHDNYEAFLDALPQFGLKAEDVEGYLELLRYGCPPHGGFAIGLERFTQKILGLSSVQEASLFPRDRKRVEP